MLQHTACCLVGVALCLMGAETAVPSDLVKSLPGLTFKPSFKSYSGYLKATDTRKLHYWFTESSSSPAGDPLVLWLNGGPGCSSLDGMLTEHGPFRVSGNGKKISHNPYAWNRVANMLYLEAPAGVGFSYSDDRNYTTTDDQVALDNHEALRSFLTSYPEYANNELYLTGESYGGIYIPTLASRLMDDSSFNLQGFAVGNGLSDYKMNTNSLLYFMYFHGLIGASLWSDMVATCCKGSVNMDRCDFVGNKGNKCQRLLQTAQASLSGLNIYNLYDECFKTPTANASGFQHLFDPRFALHSKGFFFAEEASNIKRGVGHVAAIPNGVPPCIDATGATVYLNRPDVRKALHIPPTLPTWAICSDEVGRFYVRQYTTVKDVYKKLLSAHKYRILIYNGDIDMACNFLGDQWFVDDLNLKLLKPMKSWMYTAVDGSKQVAGFSKVYSERLVFTTVRGAGHMVPQNKPIVSLDMFTKFLGKKYI